VTTKKNRLELVFGVRDEDLFNWMVENNLNSATAIKNILRAQMILGENTKVATPTIEKEEIIIENKEPEKKVGFAGINYKRM